MDARIARTRGLAALTVADAAMAQEPCVAGGIIKTAIDISTAHPADVRGRKSERDRRQPVQEHERPIASACHWGCSSFGDCWGGTGAAGEQPAHGTRESSHESGA